MTMIAYCRAYSAADVARFLTADAKGNADADAVAGLDVVYLHADLTLRREAVWDSDEPLVTSHTPGWADFCRVELGFEVPDFEEDQHGVR
jgi:hypothetical protein